MGVGKGRGAGSGMGHGVGSGDSRGKQERLAVPAMPMPVAILCCILNFLAPGLERWTEHGTMLAGLTTFCCARNEDMSGCKRLGSCCISFGIGLLQLLTTALLLLGWIWSCVWGVFFLGMSSEYYHDNPPGNDRGTVINRQGAQTAVIVQQPSQGYPTQPWVQPNPMGQPNPGGQQYPGGQFPGGQHPQPQPGMYQQPYGQPQAGVSHPPYTGPPAQPYGGGWEPPPPYTEQPPAVPSAPPAEKVLR